MADYNDILNYFKKPKTLDDEVNETLDKALPNYAGNVPQLSAGTGKEMPYPEDREIPSVATGLPMNYKERTELDSQIKDAQNMANIAGVTKYMPNAYANSIEALKNAPASSFGKTMVIPSAADKAAQNVGSVTVKPEQRFMDLVKRVK